MEDSSSHVASAPVETRPHVHPTPSDEDFPLSEPSAAWIAANEANWCNALDADVDYAINPRPPVHPCTWCGGRLVHSKLCYELQQSWIPVFPFGKHKGTRVDQVPRDYLWWAWNVGAIRDVDVKEAVRKRLCIPERAWQDATERRRYIVPIERIERQGRFYGLVRHH